MRFPTVLLFGFVITLACNVAAASSYIIVDTFDKLSAAL